MSIQTLFILFVLLTNVAKPEFWSCILTHMSQVVWCVPKVDSSKQILLHILCILSYMINIPYFLEIIVNKRQFPHIVWWKVWLYIASTMSICHKFAVGTRPPGQWGQIFGNHLEHLLGKLDINPATMGHIMIIVNG